LHKTQSGFRSNHSCETALTAIIDTWISAINDNKLVGTVFLDLTKAFDLLNHSLLIQKRTQYQFAGETLNWFKSYLSNRTQQVSISGKLSSAKEISSAVPQGSILGPALFILYINDMHLNLPNTSTDMFADDTTVTSFGSSIDSVYRSLQNSIDIIYDWCARNSMLPNP
jgi:hypothetical protein